LEADFVNTPQHPPAKGSVHHDWAEEALPAELADVADILEHDWGLRKNIIHRQIVPAQPAEYADFPGGLRAELIEVLRQQGFERLYSHQASAIGHALAGRHTVVVTPTASGKSLCYTVPLLNALLENPNARALALFPTKALAHDQLEGFLRFSRPLNRDIKIHTFDGDTPSGARRAIRNAGHVVVTNPDMLHSGVLPNHTMWVRLFEQLRYVIIDEVHMYRGVFGSHVSNVIRRLMRLCRFYGSSPQFICCSATIANPRQLCEELTGLPFQLVERSGAPRAARLFYFYNPPVVNSELGIRASAVRESQRIAMRFIAAGMQTIVFARTRARVEILTTYLRRAMEKLRRDPNRIRGYRGGYLPTERRAIEAGIRSGQILGVVSTNALELGVDIGQLRVCILTGYPGTVSSTFQQAGRAGRKEEPAVVVYVAGSSPIDQFVANHPDYLLGSSPEQAIINPDNIAILSSHIKCAAFELPFDDHELFGGQSPRPVLDFLEGERVVRFVAGRYYWSEDAYPSEHVSLRNPSAENFLVKDMTRANRVIAEVDYDSVPFLIHEKAIYIHDGTSYHVEKLDWAQRMAFVRPVKTDYYTDALDKTDIRVLEIEQEATPFSPRRDDRPLEHQGASLESGEEPPLLPVPVEATWPVEARRFGEITVQTVVAKFKKVKFDTHESVGYGDVHVPQREMQTECYWMTFHPDFIRPSPNAFASDPAAPLIGLATVLANTVPLLVMCDPRDIRAVALVRAPYDATPAVYLYDNYPGGMGLARRAFGMEARLFTMARDLVADCECRDGCPSCVGPVMELGPQGKTGTLRLLQHLCSLAGVKP
jgi:DEAD/DEAH box helicase domain-containing protein